MKTLTNVAKEIGISKGYLSKLLRGIAPVTGPEQLQMIMDGFEMSGEDFRTKFPEVRGHDAKGDLIIDIQILAPSAGVRAQITDLSSVMAHLAAIERMTGIKFTMTVST